MPKHCSNQYRTRSGRLSRSLLPFKLICLKFYWSFSKPMYSVADFNLGGTEYPKVLGENKLMTIIKTNLLHKQILNNVIVFDKIFYL